MNKVFVVVTFPWQVCRVDSIWTSRLDAIERAKAKLANFEPCYELQVEEWPINCLPDKLNTSVVWAPEETLE